MGRVRWFVYRPGKTHADNLPDSCHLPKFGKARVLKPEGNVVSPLHLPDLMI
jgi:hypothetical protein